MHCLNQRTITAFARRVRKPGKEYISVYENGRSCPLLALAFFFSHPKETQQRTCGVHRREGVLGAEAEALSPGLVSLALEQWIWCGFPSMENEFQPQLWVAQGAMVPEFASTEPIFTGIWFFSFCLNLLIRCQTPMSIRLSCLSTRGLRGLPRLPPLGLWCSGLLLRGKSPLPPTIRPDHAGHQGGQVNSLFVLGR